MLLLIIILGFIFGNFTTSFYYRISNNKPVNGYKKLSGEAPHCSVCKNPLRFYEYLPILSLIATKFSFKCNYCAAPINRIYTVLEFSVALTFILHYLLVPAEQPFILLSFFAPTMILLIALRQGQHNIPSYLFWFMCFLGVIYRTVLDGDFYTWLTQISVLAIFVIAEQKDKDFKLMEIIAKYAAIACACCWLLPLQLIILIIMHMLAVFFKVKDPYRFHLDLLLLYGMTLFSEMRGI